jgi:glycosyltransferase involved in cell wall biosynthesis
MRFITNHSKIKIIRSGINRKFYDMRHDEYDKKAFLQKYQIPNNSKIILYVGRIDPTKGLTILIEAFNQVQLKIKKCYLFIVGGYNNNNQYKKYLEHMAKEKGILEKIFFTGYQNQSNLLNYYAASNVFILPSFMESSPLTLREAMAFKLPLIITGVGGVLEYLSEYPRSIVIPPRNVLKLTDAIFEILSENKISNKEVNIKKYTWQDYVDHTEKIISKILINKKKGVIDKNVK